MDVYFLGGFLEMGFEYYDNCESGVCIKVVGVGGGGNNAVVEEPKSALELLEKVFARIFPRIFP